MTNMHWETTLPHTRGFGQHFAAVITRDDDGIFLLGGQKAKSMDGLNTAFSVHHVRDFAFDSTHLASPAPLR